MAPMKGGDSPWSNEHTKDVVRGIIECVMNNRKSFYIRPNLLEVNNNSSHRINQKIQQILREIESFKGVEGTVKNLVDGGKAGRTGRPRKRKDSEEGGTGSSSSGSPQKKAKKGRSGKVKGEVKNEQDEDRDWSE